MQYVSVITKGGIGNILFQVAAGYAYAKRHGKVFVLSDKFHQVSTHAPIGNFSSLLNFQKKDIEFDHLWNEPTFCYHEIPPMDGNVLLSGYFQSSKYFEDCIEDVRSWLKVEKEDCGFIHVRRGDYLNNPDYHNPLRLSYYVDAIDNLSKDSYYVMSDDTEWIARRFHGSRFNIYSATALQCLEKMASCKYGIISNSTFSWWGAFFSGSNEIVAPKKWFGPEGPKIHDIYMKEWTLV